MATYCEQNLGGGVRCYQTVLPERSLSFNSYHVAAPKSALIHTGSVTMWPDLRRAMHATGAEVAYVVVPHFEADECGAIVQVLAEYPAQVLASAVTVRQLNGFGLDVGAQVVGDGEVVDLGGGFALEFVATPSEVHLWPGLMAFERQTGTLFSSDFWGQTGIPATSVGVDEQALWAMRQHCVPVPEPFADVAQRLRGLNIRQIAPGHGQVIRERVEKWISAYFEVAR